MLRLVSAAMVIVLGIMPLTPAQHAHESELDGDHAAVIHRHGGSPFVEHSPQHDRGGRAFDHIDGRTITFDSSFTVPASFVVAAPAAAVVAVLTVPPVTLAGAPASDVERLIHGPPRAPSGLRAPPLSARL